jgi:hypothetical protein
VEALVRYTLLEDFPTLREPDAGTGPTPDRVADPQGPGSDEPSKEVKYKPLREYHYNCMWCGAPFVTTVWDRRYCPDNNDRCKNAAKNHRAKERRAQIAQEHAERR